MDWDPANVIAMRQGVAESQARQVISLVEQECTVPFIARYRREKTGDITIDKLREVVNAYEQLREVKQKVTKVVKDENKDMSAEVRSSLLKATSLQEVKTLTASLKTANKRSLADRARQLGLGPAADSLFKDPNVGGSRLWAQDLVATQQEGRRTVEEVEHSLKYILADLFSKDPKMMEYMKTWCVCRIVLVILLYEIMCYLVGT